MYILSANGKWRHFFIFSQLILINALEKKRKPEVAMEQFAFELQNCFTTREKLIFSLHLNFILRAQKRIFWIVWSHEKWRQRRIFRSFSLDYARTIWWRNFLTKIIRDFSFMKLSAKEKNLILKLNELDTRLDKNLKWTIKRWNSLRLINR